MNTGDNQDVTITPFSRERIAYLDREGRPIVNTEGADTNCPVTLRESWLRIEGPWAAVTALLKSED